MRVETSTLDSSIQQPRRLSRCLRAGIGFVVLLIGCLEIGIAADDCEIESTTEPAPVTAPPDNRHEADSPVPPGPKLDLEKRKKATAALAAIGGIAILGVGIIAVTMVWARRLRLLARDLGPAQTTTGNDFWFLKPPKVMVSEIKRTDGHPPRSSPPSTDTPEKTP